MMHDSGTISNEVDLDVVSTTSRKAPKLVYCGDGVLEEYSDDDENGENDEENRDAAAAKEQESQIDTVSLLFHLFVL